MSRLLEEYKTQISKNLMSKLGLKNIHQVPKIKKIVINMGIGVMMYKTNRNTIN